MQKRFSFLAKALLIATLPVTVFAHNVEKQQVDQNMDLKYPLVYLANEKAQQNINTDVASVVDSAKKLYQSGKPQSVYLKYDVKYEDDKYLSIVYTTSWMYQGAAHGMFNQQGVVYDKKTGEKLPLAYFLKINSPAQIEAGIKSNRLPLFDQSLKNRLTLDNFYSVDNISNSYYLGGNGDIYVIYQPYELSSYATGATRVFFSREAVDYFNMLNK